MAEPNIRYLLGYNNPIDVTEECHEILNNSSSLNNLSHSAQLVLTVALETSLLRVVSTPSDDDTDPIS